MKAAIVEVFEQIGGVDEMAVWARENRTEFYRIASRLIPTEITGKDGKDLIPEMPSDLELARRMAFVLELGVREAESVRH